MARCYNNRILPTDKLPISALTHFNLSHEKKRGTKGLNATLSQHFPSDRNRSSNEENPSGIMSYKHDHITKHSIFAVNVHRLSCGPSSPHNGLYTLFADHSQILALSRPGCAIITCNPFVTATVNSG